MPRILERRNSRAIGAARIRQSNDSRGSWLATITGCPRLMVFLTFLLICALTGGVARWDALPLVVVRSAAILTIGLLAILPGSWNWRGLRVPFALLGMFTVSIAIQLVPLPPTVWSMLPGRAPYLTAAVIAGIDQPWRPISLIPYRTANSLLATLPAFAGLIALASIPRARWIVVADAIMILCCASGLLGVLQFGTDALYPYSPSDVGLPIGLLANRNHQALLLAIGILLLGYWGMRRDQGGREIPMRALGAMALILVLITVTLLTGSRAGLWLMLATVVITVSTAALRTSHGRHLTSLRLVLIAAPIAMIGVGAYMARMSGFVRLGNSINSMGEDMRLLALPTVWQMAKHYFPTGAGFGTFDQIFMQFEPDHLLKRTFYNRAHSEPLEVLITGGLPSALITLVFLFWLGYRIRMSFFSVGRSERRTRETHLCRYAIIAVVLVLLASLVDYPLRTPIFSLVFVLLCGLSYRDIGPASRSEML